MHSVQHFTLGFHQTPPRGSHERQEHFRAHVLFKSALASSVSGSLRQGPERTLTSYSAPMPGARRVARGDRSPPARHRTGLVVLTSGSSGRRGSSGLGSYSDVGVSTRSYPIGKHSCLGAVAMEQAWYSFHLFTKKTKPWSAKKALSRVLSTIAT